MSHEALAEAMEHVSLEISTPQSPASTFITVDIGAPHLSLPHHDIFLVPRADLTRSSLYLRARLAYPHTTAIELPEINAPLFASYLDHLEAGYVQESSFHRLALLFALAAQLQDADFSRAVLRGIIGLAQQTSSYPGLGVINIIYGASERGSGARKLLTDFYVYGVGREWLNRFERGEEKADQDYIDQVLVALATKPMGQKELPWVKDAKAYLGEGDGDEDGEDDTMSSKLSDDEDENKEDDGFDEANEMDLGTDDQSPTTPLPLSICRPPTPGLTTTPPDRTRS
ncbi:hypothetical protein PMIN04_008239 [Paraphaeosphaeria minitans]